MAKTPTYALYMAGGSQHGRDIEGWLEAELQLSETRRALSLPSRCSQACTDPHRLLSSPLCKTAQISLSVSLKFPQEVDSEWRGAVSIAPIYKEKNMENGNKVRRLGLLLGMSALLLYGCNTTPDQPQANTTSTPSVSPVVSINAVMVALVDHASHVLWDVEKKGGAPKSDSDWREIEHHTIQLASAGTLIAAGGTGKADQGWSQSSDWKKYAQQLNDLGLAASKAAGTKNLDALVKVNGQLVETCEGCHKEFKPDLPTEGITHSH